MLYCVGVILICNSPRYVLNRVHTQHFIVNHCTAQTMSIFICYLANFVGSKRFDVPPWNASEHDGRACSSGSHDSKPIENSASLTPRGIQTDDLTAGSLPTCILLRKLSLPIAVLDRMRTCSSLTAPIKWGWRKSGVAALPIIGSRTTLDVLDQLKAVFNLEG